MLRINPKMVFHTQKVTRIGCFTDYGKPQTLKEYVLRYTRQSLNIKEIIIEIINYFSLVVTLLARE